MLDRLNALKAIKTDSEQTTDPAKQEELAEARAKRVEIDGRAQFFALRGRWSWTIIIWISVLIVFNIASRTFLAGISLLVFVADQSLVLLTE